MKVAAVQLEAVVANISENLARCERLVIDAVAAGAEWVMLPEFFSTGMAFDDALASAALPPDGVAVEMMMTLAKRNHITIGGSFLCRDADGHTRNAYFLVSPSGEILGRHDKDLPRCGRTATTSAVTMRASSTSAMAEPQELPCAGSSCVHRQRGDYAVESMW